MTSPLPAGSRCPVEVCGAPGSAASAQGLKGCGTRGGLGMPPLAFAVHGCHRLGILWHLRWWHTGV